MKRIWIFCLLAVLCLAACSCQNGLSFEQATTEPETTEPETTVHEHVPNGADCQNAVICQDCGEQLAEQGEHVYPDEPDAEQDGFLYYVCKVCGKIKIVNNDGAPVVPVG